VIFRSLQRFRVAGITSVCVDPEFRGKGVSSLLMNYTLNFCRSAGFELALLFARRAADHYYTRFGFWGIAAYSRATIRLDNRALPELSTFRFAPATSFDETYSQAHAETYAECFGRFERSPAYWRFLFDRLGVSPGLEWLSISSGNTIVGYAFIAGGTVAEIACLQSVDPLDVLAAIRNRVGTASPDRTIVLDLPPQHHMLSGIRDTDIKLERRECSYGGHMVRILNTEAVADKLASRVSSLLPQKSVAREVMECDRLRIAPKRDTRRYSNNDTSLSFRQTSWLLGAQTISASCPTIDRLLPFNVSLPDQF